MIKNEVFDWQGHRGARGLLPENTIPAFLKALEFPQVQTLELDLAVTKDGQLLISHEPWFSEEICTKPDGVPVTKSEAMNLRIFSLTYSEIKQYDCGKRIYPRFPEQQKIAVSKPLFSDMVRAVESYCAEKNRSLPRYNLEIKSDPKGDNVFHPTPETFVKILLKEIDDLGIKNRVCIQSFDERPLQVLHKLNEQVTMAFLVENKDGLEKNLEKLGFIPSIYSPYFMLVSKKLVASCHEKGMKIIPWTVNDTQTMQRLIRFGVDGIITDYPNRILGN